jgi:hypothetical protein
MHPQTRLGYEILPCLRELDDHEWTAEETGVPGSGGAPGGTAAGGVGETPLGRAGAKLYFINVRGE